MSQQALALLALLGRELLVEAPAPAPELLMLAREPLLPGRGERYQHGPAIAHWALATDDAGTFEGVDEASRRGRGDAGAFGQLADRHGAPLLEGEQQVVLGQAHLVGGLLTAGLTTPDRQHELVPGIGETLGVMPLEIVAQTIDTSAL